MAEFSLQHRQATEQQQVQQLALTQQFQQSLHLLQANVLTLHQLVAKACVANPFLAFLSEPLAGSVPATREQPAAVPVQLQAAPPTLSDHLLNQIHLTMRPNELRKWVIFLVNHLDENGYLPTADYAIWQQQASTRGVELIDAVTLLQELDPPGIGARSLSECLALQLRRKLTATTLTDQQRAQLQLAEQIASDALPLLAQHKWEQLAARYHVTEAQLLTVLAIIKRLSPNPAAGFTPDVGGVIFPDAVVTVAADQVKFTLTRSTQPQVRFLAAKYERMLLNAQPEEQRYIIQQRKNYQQLASDLAARGDTLTKITAAICRKQKNFFTSRGHQLVPWLLRELAAELQLHESTVSRAISGKYLQTTFGVFAYRSFFVRAAKQTAADHPTSRAALLQQLQQLVAAEDKSQPLSDQQLADMLARSGWQVSRRTVAKYRQQLGIANKSMRRMSS